jgi:hypothetical protein
MNKKVVDTTAATLGVHPLVAIRFLVTGTTANCMFATPIMRKIAKAWKDYQR